MLGQGNNSKFLNYLILFLTLFGINSLRVDWVVPAEALAGQVPGWP
jgi:hypothetical protein